MSSCSFQPPLDTRILCEIQSDLAGANERKFVEKNKRFWSIGKHYLKVGYQVRVIIGPADIRFELCEFTCFSLYPRHFPPLANILAPTYILKLWG
jgi:hypothetical protein